MQAQPLIHCAFAQSSWAQCTISGNNVSLIEFKHMGILAPTAPIILALHVWGGMRTTIPLQHFTAEMAETVKFMFSKVADRATVYGSSLHRITNLL